MGQQPQANDGSRGLVTLAVIAYRQEDLIRPAIESAFAQTYDRLEIILSDDGSPDGTFRIMQDMAAAYRGPHRLRLNRNPTNLGLTGHVNRIFELAEGELIVPNAGDDISLPERCAVLYQAFEKGRAPLLYSDHLAMTFDGQIQGPRSRRETVERLTNAGMAHRAMDSVVGASCAWTPALYDVFGPITEPGAYEDAVLFSRAFLLGRIEHVAHPLVQYRQGGQSRGEDSLERRIHKKEVAEAVMRQRKKDVLAFSDWLAGEIDEEQTAIRDRLAHMRGRLERRASQT